MRQMDNMSDIHKIISKAEKVTYTQKLHSKNHTFIHNLYCTYSLCSIKWFSDSYVNPTYLLYFVNIRTADKLCLIDLGSSAVYTLPV